MLNTFLGVSSSSPPWGRQAVIHEEGAAQPTLAGDRATLRHAGSEDSQSMWGSGVAMDKVAAIQRALADGTYEVPATMVAKKVIDSMIEAGRKRRLDGNRDRRTAKQSMGKTQMRHDTRKAEWNGMLVDAFHALEHLDAIRLEEMALSCAALVCDRKRAQGNSGPCPQTSPNGGNEAQRSSASTAFTTE